MRSRLPRLLVALLALPAFLGSGPPSAKTAVAVLRFDNNTCAPQYENLGRALSSMMVTDLSVVEEIQLVERERLEEVLGELQFQQTPYVDPASAQTLGQIVGAEYVVTGAFLTMDPEMRLDTRVVRVATSEILKTAEVIGPRDQFFDLQQRLADELIDGLALTLSEAARERLRAQQEANRIDDLATAVAFSRALCLLDNGYYVDGLEAVQEVREAAPGSRLVQATLELLREKAAGEAKNQVVEQAGRRLGGLLGRNRTPQRTRPPPPC